MDISPVINLVSDTVTLPTKEMKEAMLQAPLGDDVFKEDPTVNQLQVLCAKMFGFEDALFCASGTLANQIAIQLHTNPLDEILCDVNSHVYQFETGGYAFHSRVAINPLQGPGGKLNPDIICESIRPAYDWFPSTRLVCIENTGNRTGGNFYTLNELRDLSNFCRANNLSIHLDGARIFNACIEGNYQPLDMSGLFDSISICFSKGLGAPVGSILLASAEKISRARKIRKVMGGGMRQAGILAAGCIYALQNHVARLKTDHNHAQRIFKVLQTLPYVSAIKPVFTNIIIFDITEKYSPNEFLEYLRSHHILATAFGKQSIRFVTHLDITDIMIDKVCEVLLNFKA